MLKLVQKMGVPDTSNMTRHQVQKKQLKSRDVGAKGNAVKKLNKTSRNRSFHISRLFAFYCERYTSTRTISARHSPDLLIYDCASSSWCKSLQTRAKLFEPSLSKTNFDTNRGCEQTVRRTC